MVLRNTRFDATKATSQRKATRTMVCLLTSSGRCRMHVHVLRNTESCATDLLRSSAPIVCAAHLLSHGSRLLRSCARSSDPQPSGSAPIICSDHLLLSRIGSFLLPAPRSQPVAASCPPCLRPLPWVRIPVRILCGFALRNSFLRRHSGIMYFR